MAQKRYNKKQKINIAILTLLLFCCGIAVSGFYQTVNTEIDDTEITAEDRLIDLITNLEQENAELDDKIAELLTKSDNFIISADSYSSVLTSFLEESNKNKTTAGLTELTGSGIVIELNDNDEGAAEAKARNEQSYTATDYIVHDTNLLYIVNDLKPYAVGIAINGQRIIYSSPIRCVGTVITVNQTRIAPPYKIALIGNTDTLLKALEKSNNYKTMKSSNILISVTKAKDLTLPAYTGKIGADSITSDGYNPVTIPVGNNNN